MNRELPIVLTWFISVCNYEVKIVSPIRSNEKMNEKLSKFLISIKKSRANLSPPRPEMRVNKVKDGLKIRSVSLDRRKTNLKFKLLNFKFGFANQKI